MKQTLFGGPLDGAEVTVPDSAPQIVLVPYRAQGPPNAPAPAHLVYIWSQGRYRFYR